MINFCNKYDYILGQRPVFECFDYRLRGKLRYVCKWLNKYVHLHNYELEMAQKVLRKHYMRQRLYRALCLSVTQKDCIKVEHLQIICNSIIHTNCLPLHRCLLLLCSAKDYDKTLTKCINNNERKNSAFSRVADYNVTPVFDYDAKIVDGYHDYEIHNFCDVIKYVGVQILGGTNRVLHFEVGMQTVFRKALDNRAVFVRLYINLPIVALYKHGVLVRIEDCGQSKYLLCGCVFLNEIRRAIVKNWYEGDAHRFWVEEFDMHGKSLSKTVYERGLVIRDGFFGLVQFYD